MPFTTSFGVNTLFRSRSDRILLWSLRGAAAIAGAIVLFIVSFVAWEALPALRHIGVLRFVTDASWHPTEGQYNLLPMLMGTVFVTGGAIIIATPLGILSAIFCTHYAPPLLATPYRRTRGGRSPILPPCCASTSLPTAIYATGLTIHSTHRQ